MNPTTCFFVKLSILVALSCQVLGSDHFGGDGILSKLEALHHDDPARRLRRRQIELGGATDPKVDATQATAATAKDNTKVDAKGDLPAPAGAKDANNKPQNLSKEEQLATKLFEGIIEMGVGLEGVTNLGSSTKEIVDQSKKVSQMLPTVKTLTTELLGAAPKKSDELNKAVEESTKAGEAITKSLIAIEAKVDDANVIKQEYKNLEKSFLQILKTSDGLAVAAIPKLAEQANQAHVEEAGGAAVKVAGPSGEAAGGANAATALSNKDEGKKADAPKDAGDKGLVAEKKGDGAKLGELKPKAAAPEGPIDTGVVIPGQ
ncbi:hypothetical protein PtA15_9A610 [Puccinia triticina]|uniref:Uncharacterized protein n=1 Tax=Puccinia triticina TaxID=208348 RepID=A0ABY7CVW6_9BASI|nr:uncharacterized protein PtA15_9A610 [Puccinia triticina]WAQ88483.1 hypothetical protein PtA15_9A610 [Puccinia triticina]WAR60660.1 hypothetical protein PtB15_9B599 [Puccinia triticina]